MVGKILATLGKDNAVFGKVLAILGLLCLICYLALVCRSCPCRWRRRTSSADIETGDEHEWQRASSVISLDELEKDAFEGADRIRRETSRVFVNLSMHCAAGFLVVLVTYYSVIGVWSPEYEGLTLANESIIFGVAVCCFGLLVDIFPSLLTVRFVNGCHILLMTLLLAKTYAVISLGNAYLFALRSQSTTLLRLSMGSMFGGLVCTTVLNCLFSAGSIGMYLAYTRDDDLDEGFGENGAHELFFVCTEIITTTGIAVVCYTIEARGYDMAYATVKEKISSQAAGTINALLTAICDAVVHLNSDYDVSVGLEKLQALLLKQPCANLCFLDVLTDADKERFVDACKSSHNCSSIAPALHVGMRDAAGTLVNIQLYVTSLPMRVGDCHEYILGLRETSREEDDMVAGPQPSVGSENFAIAASIGSQQSYLSNVSAQSDLSDDSCSSCSSNTGLRQVELPAAESTVYFDASTWIVKQATTSFIAIGGPSTIGADMNDFIKQSPDFKVFLQGILDGARQGQRSTNRPFEFDCLRLQPPAESSQIYYKARCKVQLIPFENPDAEEDDEISDDEAYLVRATFTSPRRHSGTRAQGKSNLRGRSSKEKIDSLKRTQSPERIDAGKEKIDKYDAGKDKIDNLKRTQSGLQSRMRL